MTAPTPLDQAKNAWLTDHSDADPADAFTAGWDSRRWELNAEQQARLTTLETAVERLAADTVYARMVAALASRHQTGAEIVERPWTITEKAAALVDAFKQALPAGALDPATLQLLLQVFTAAFAVQCSPLAQQGGSVYRFAGILLGQDGDADWCDLAEAIRSEAAQPVADMDFVTAARALEPLYVELDARRRELVTAMPRTLVAQLVDAETRWQLPA